MGSKSDYLENKLLNHVLGGEDYSRPATVYIALYTVAPTDAGGGTEVSGASYARAAVANNATNFPAAAGGGKANGTVIEFVRAEENWGTIVAWGIFDAATGDNLMFWGAVTEEREIQNGDMARIAVGGISLTED